jgi:hypothetical protein
VAAPDGDPDSKFPVLREFFARPFCRPRRKQPQFQSVARIAIHRLRDRGPLEQGIYVAQKRTEQGIFVLFARGTGNLQNCHKSAVPRLYRGIRLPAVTSDPAVSETISSVWKN